MLCFGIMRSASSVHFRNTTKRKRERTKVENGRRYVDTWRLRVRLGLQNGRYKWEYLHRVVAWAYHRQRHAKSKTTYDAFVAAKYQGDHLPAVISDRIETRPELCIAGWVEAVSARVHKKRTVWLREARRCEELAAAFEQQEAHGAKIRRELTEGLAALSEKAKGVKRPKDTAQEKWAKLKAKSAANMQQNKEMKLHRLMNPTDEEILERGRLTIPINGIDIGHPLEPCEDFDNPYLSCLVFESKLDQRQRLYCMLRGMEFRRRTEAMLKALSRKAVTRAKLRRVNARRRV